MINDTFKTYEKKITELRKTKKTLIKKQSLLVILQQRDKFRSRRLYTT